MLSVAIINRSGLPLPAYQTAGSAGMDLAACLPGGPVSLQPMERRLFPTGLFIALPDGFEGQVRPRSGTAFKRGLTLINSPGTVDSDYRGELLVPIINLSAEIQIISHGERIAQLVIARCEQAFLQEVTELPETQRSGGGFGHTGGHNLPISQ